MTTIDERLAQIANRRHGIVRIDQARAVGISKTTVARLVSRGRATRVHPGVLSIGHAPLSRESRWMAAVDAGGPGAVLSGRSAAQLYRIDRVTSHEVEILVPRRHRPIVGIRTRQTRSLIADDVTTVRGIPVLRVERLLVELADEHDEGRLCAWIDEARHKRLLQRRRLARVMARHRNRRGHARLVRAIDMLDDGGKGHRSRWEERVAGRILRPSGVTRRDCTTVIIASTSLEPDVHFPELQLVVEIDGPDHDRPNRRRSDARRDRVLRAVGTTTMRIHWTAEDEGVRAVNDEIRRRMRNRRT